MSSQTTQAGGKPFNEQDKARIQANQQDPGQTKKDSFPARVQHIVDSNAAKNQGAATGGSAAK